MSILSNAATHLMMAFKKGMSALEIGRLLSLSKKTAWFLCHRIRESLRETKPEGPLGGQNMVVEADETYIGKETNKHKSKRREGMQDGKSKEAVVALSGLAFGGHGTVNHSIEEYVRGGFWHDQHGRELFRDLEARHLRHLPPRQPAALEALSCRVRLPLQRARSSWRRRFRAHDQIRARHCRQAFNLSAA